MTYNSLIDTNEATLIAFKFQTVVSLNLEHVDLYELFRRLNFFYYGNNKSTSLEICLKNAICSSIFTIQKPLNLIKNFRVLSNARA